MPHKQWSWRYQLGISLLLALVQMLVLLTTFGVALGNCPDEGTIALQAIRVTQGQLAHRDYFLQTPIGGDIWVGAWFSLFGDSLESLRSYFLAEMMLMVCTIHFLSCRLLGRGWSELPALLFLCHSPFCWFIPSPRWDAALFLLLAISSQRLALLAGFWVALAALTLHPAGAAGAMGMAGALALTRDWARLRHFLWGILAIWFPYILFLTYHNLVSTFLYDTLYFNLTRYVATQKSSLAWSQIGANLSAGWVVLGEVRDFPSFLRFVAVSGYGFIDLVTYGFWFPLAVIGPIVALKVRNPIAMGASFTLAFLTLLELVRPNRYHFQFHAALLLIVLVWLASKLGRGGRAFLGLVLLAHLGVLGGHLRSNLASNLPVGTARGTLYVSSPTTAAILKEFMAINRSLPVNEKMFVFTDNPMLQWLFGRGPVTREVVAFPLFYSYDQYAAIRRDLDREGVENLVFCPMNYDAQAFPEISMSEAYAVEAWLRRYFTEGYRVYREVAGVTFYRRLDLPDP